MFSFSHTPYVRQKKRYTRLSSLSWYFVVRRIRNKTHFISNLHFVLGIKKIKNINKFLTISHWGCVNNHGIEKKKAQYPGASSVSAFPKLQAVGWVNRSVFGIAFEVSSFPRFSVPELDNSHFIEPYFQRSSRICIVLKKILAEPSFLRQDLVWKVRHPDKNIGMLCMQKLFFGGWVVYIKHFKWCLHSNKRKEEYQRGKETKISN